MSYRCKQESEINKLKYKIFQLEAQIAALRVEIKKIWQKKLEVYTT